MPPVPKPQKKAKEKKKRNTPLTTLIKKADKVFSKWIRKRDKNACVCCGTTNNPTCGHLITRTKASVRFDVQNNHCQCRNCNFKHEFNPEIYTAFFINKYGATAYEDLVRRSQEIKKWTREELENIIEAYS